MSVTAVPRQDTNTLVVGAGQAGLATSYWLAQRGVEHRILEQRPALGGAWQDRWDSFYLNTPNFSVGISPDVPQLDSHDYRNPGQLPDGAVLLVGIDAPEAEAAEPDSWRPPGSGARLDLHGEGITSIIWSTGYALDFSMLDLPLLDEWNYPRHTKGVTEHPGLYAVGLPWLTRHISATLVGVGPDAEHVTEHLAARG